MKPSTRRRIFYVFLLLFVVISIVVVLYAEGWRLNPTTLDAEKAGGIYVRSYPQNAQITLDGKSIQNQSAFLSSGTFISGLFPKNYTVQLKNPGYDTWTETAPVIPSLVTEFKYSVLVPQNGTTIPASGSVASFFEVDRNVVVQNTTGTILLNGTPIGNGTIVSHSTNLRTAIIRKVNPQGGTVSYWLYNFGNSTSATTTNLMPALQQLGINITATLNIFIDPYDDTNIIVQTPNKIFIIDSDTQIIGQIAIAPAGETIGSPLAISPSVMAWALSSSNASTSQVMIYDKFSGDIIDDSLIVPGTIKQLAWIKDNELGVLENDNSLYTYNVSDEQLTKLADDVKQFYSTTDGNSIAALEYNSLEVFAFSTSNYYRFNLPDIGNVQGLTWYKDQNHLFVIYSDHVSFLDFTDANLKNFTTVSAGTMPWYDPQENSLYLIDPQQQIVQFEFPQ